MKIKPIHKLNPVTKKFDTYYVATEVSKGHVAEVVAKTPFKAIQKCMQAFFGLSDNQLIK